MDQSKLDLFCAGIEHGLDYGSLSNQDHYYGGQSISRIRVEKLEKAIPKISISGIKEEPIDLYIRELILELQSKMLSEKFKKKAIKSALEQYSEVKFKDKNWWGSLTNAELESLIGSIKSVYSGQTLMLSEGLREAYLFGKLHSVLTESDSLKNARKRLTAYRQSPIDEAAIKHIDDTANLFWNKAISRELDPVSIRLLQNNRDATTGILKTYFESPKKSWRSVASDIYHGIDRSHKVTLRDIDRITLTEISSAQNSGILNSLYERGKKTFFVIVRPTACKLCKSMYLNDDGTPKRFDVSEMILLPRDTNWGARKGDTVISQPPPRHPHCFCLVQSN